MFHISQHSYHAIAGRVATGLDVESEDGDNLDEGKEEAFSCPELLHNLDMLIEETEMKILSVRNFCKNILTFGFT